MNRKSIYLDNAASTQIPSLVIDQVVKCMEEFHGNPSSVHSQGRKAKVRLEEARRKIAGLLHATPSEIFFTSGGTEANNTILWGCLNMGRKSFISSRLEHPAVLKTLENLRRFEGVDVGFVNVNKLGHIDLDHLENMLKNTGNAVVTLMHANNEIGNLLPVKDVSALCKRFGALFHSDTVQTIGKYEMDFSLGHFDFAVASAHKFHGPKGVGFMYVRNGHALSPLIAGGNQERGLRAGTENVCGITGLAAALEWVVESLPQTSRHVRELKSFLTDSLEREFPGVVLNGDTLGSSIYTIVNFTLPVELELAILLSRLDLEGICVSSGSACSSGSVKGSHVLAAIGADTDKPSIRVSFSGFNSKEDVTYLVNTLKKILR